MIDPASASMALNQGNLGIEDATRLPRPEEDPALEEINRFLEGIEGLQIPGGDQTLHLEGTQVLDEVSQRLDQIAVPPLKSPEPEQTGSFLGNALNFTAGLNDHFQGVFAKQGSIGYIDSITQRTSDLIDKTAGPEQPAAPEPTKPQVFSADSVSGDAYLGGVSSGQAEQPVDQAIERELDRIDAETQESIDHQYAYMQDSLRASQEATQMSARFMFWGSSMTMLSSVAKAGTSNIKTLLSAQ